MLERIESRIVSTALRVATGPSRGSDCDRRSFLGRALTSAFGVLAGIAIFAKPLHAACAEPDVGPCPMGCVEIDPCSDPLCMMCPSYPEGCQNVAGCCEGCASCGCNEEEEECSGMSWYWAECYIGAGWCFCQQELECGACS